MFKVDIVQFEWVFLFLNVKQNALQLTFDVEFDKGGLAHAKWVLGHAAIEASREPADGAEDDLALVADDGVSRLLLPPGDLGLRVAVHHAPDGGVILLVFQVIQVRRLDINSWRI